MFIQNQFFPVCSIACGSEEIKQIHGTIVFKHSELLVSYRGYTNHRWDGDKHIYVAHKMYI